MPPDRPYSLHSEFQRKLKLLDNLNIKGVKDDTAKGGRQRKNRGRKAFVLQARYVYKRRALHSPGLGWLFRRLQNWYTHSRYSTESARDEAYAAMVKKARSLDDHISRQEYRKL